MYVYSNNNHPHNIIRILAEYERVHIPQTFLVALFPTKSQICEVWSVEHKTQSNVFIYINPTAATFAWLLHGCAKLVIFV